MMKFTHDIEKQLLVQELFDQIWCWYREMIPAINSRNVVKPKLIAEPRAIKSAGTYTWPDMIVFINTTYVNEHTSIESLKDTIAHELAHHITKMIYPAAKQWHGVEFRSVMNQIGYDGDTYHHMSVAVARSVAKRSKDQLFDL